ncbi:copper chaperone PCu(A)C [Planosporangium flavigriseum]|uniref:Copper(I)-binding protein n=1 Tax=Planosporangium flavigriseum TaxID=373681 RepID=A0A8J3LSB7_9ACTN|nr:copper chaperone PCu(A)C [Planosporangium flavigriseum]NJC63868.1 copper chaperone PCu(A)C [Planosporangium flavigriseum]GIG75905.1 hypothetical protein Pfl04_43090 [Planosporangium flavigriseum]
MPRFITGSLSRRRMMRAAALLAAPAAAVALLSGCSAGQISQTDTMVAPVDGVEVNSQHRLASLRDVQIKYNKPEGYAKGETAPLQVFIANNQPAKPLVLSSVKAVSKKTGASLGTVVLTGGAADIETLPSSSPSSASSAPVSPSTSPSGRASASQRPSASAAASSSASPAASPSSTAPSAAPSAASASLTIPGNGFARLDPEHGAYLAITDITESLAPGSSVVVTFTFEGEDPVEIVVPFETPLSPAARVTPSGGSEH